MFEFKKKTRQKWGKVEELQYLLAEQCCREKSCDNQGFLSGAPRWVEVRNT